MDNYSLQRRAAVVHSSRAKQRRQQAIFTLCFRGGGVSQVTGHAALAQALQVKESSLPVLFSKGGGRSFTLKRRSPLTNEPDVLTVTKAPPAKEPTRRGRPPKPKVELA